MLRCPVAYPSTRRSAGATVRKTSQDTAKPTTDRATAAPRNRATRPGSASMAASTPSIAATAKTKYITTPSPSKAALCSRMRFWPISQRRTAAAAIAPPDEQQQQPSSEGRDVERNCGAGHEIRQHRRDQRRHDRNREHRRQDQCRLDL